MKIKAKVPNKVRSRKTGGGGVYCYRKGVLRAYGTIFQVCQALEEGFRPFYTYLERDWVVTPCFVPIDIFVDEQEMQAVFFPCRGSTQERIFPADLEKLPGYNAWRDSGFKQGIFWELKPIENRIPI